MEVDNAEQVAPVTETLVPSSPPTRQDGLSPKRRSRSATAPLQQDMWATPKSRVSKSRSPSTQAQQAAASLGSTEGEVTQQLEQSSFSASGSGPEDQSTNVPTKTEDTSEDITMDTLPYNPPLPIARIDSEHSASEYVLEAKVTPGPPPPTFEFTSEPIVKVEEEEKKTIAPSLTLYKEPTYTLPPLKQLPPEFHRKGRQRQSRKRDKEKSEGKAGQEWAPLGLNRWSAVLRANPVHKKVSKASKCLSTREWNVRGV